MHLDEPLPSLVRVTRDRVRDTHLLQLVRRRWSTRCTHTRVGTSHPYGPVGRGNLLEGRPGGRRGGGAEGRRGGGHAHAPSAESIVARTGDAARPCLWDEIDPECRSTFATTPVLTKDGSDVTLYTESLASIGLSLSAESARVDDVRRNVVRSWLCWVGSSVLCANASSDCEQHTTTTC